jgi:hypothetical protein
MCSRLDAMVMAYNLLGAPAAGNTGILERYEDYYTIPTTRPVYRQAVAYFLAKGVISGCPDGTLRVSTGVTRAEMLSLMNKVNDLIAKTTEQTENTPTLTPAPAASQTAIATATANVDRDNWPAPKPPGNDYSHIGGNEPQGTPEPTETDSPSEEPEPTESIAPTEEPGPTEPEAPTDEPEPTEPEAPTEEPEPTEPEAPTEEPEPTESGTPGLPDGVPDGAVLIEPGTNLDDALKNNAPDNYYITSSFAVAQYSDLEMGTGVNLYVAAGATLTAGKGDMTLTIPAGTTLAVVTGGTVTTINRGHILINGTFTIAGGEVTTPSDGSSPLNIYVTDGCTLNNGQGDALLSNIGQMWINTGGLINWGAEGDATYHLIGSKPLHPVRQNAHARSDETDGQYLIALTAGELIIESVNGYRIFSFFYSNPYTIAYLNQAYTLQASDDWTINTGCELHLQAPLTWHQGVGILEGSGSIIDEDGTNFSPPGDYPNSRRQPGPDQVRTYYFDTVTGKWKEMK